ncbi:MAG: efflux RND transporter periplasmic adaptor subunit [Bacteroidota bacterium]|nr:efflux RND transporter periplasmic adaptor subunit [Bacteroidota bacterium]MDP4232127.1 efflux RND transporter periplasmic adaptor subunit [Bacteroidota bacterium]MDP4241165.1 efflux RND transporter periplasmic adaptor subunit [Bacteroidota bacterium]MDP4286557.1 efflux RND transporter periplasmic adaptor subunit [Bacteroidota bacterium]
MLKSLSAVLLATGLLFSGCSKSENPNELTASGTIETTDVNVAAKTPGQIAALYIDEGTRVDSGSLIAVQDHSALDIQLRSADAAVGAGRAQYTLTENGARREDIKQAEEAVAQAQTNRRLAADDLERMHNLEKGNAATRQQVDQAEAHFRVTQSQLVQAEENAAKLKHLARPEEVTGAAARVQQLEAERDRVRKMIDDSYITSPIRGIVTQKVLQQGELAAQGATVATITDLSKVYLMIYLIEAELPRVKLGESVDVRVDGMPKKTFQGRVTYISPEAEFTPKNIQTKDDRVKLVFGVKIEIPNPTGELKKGLPADATIHLEPGSH